VWDCCDKIGTEPGCKFSRHESNPDRSKRHCGNVSDLSSNEAEGEDASPEEEEEEEEEE